MDYRPRRIQCVIHERGNEDRAAEKTVERSSKASSLRKCSQLDRFRELLTSELIHSLDEHLCIADLAERPSGVAKTPVLFAVDIVTQLLAHQAESGPPPEPNCDICRITART